MSGGEIRKLPKNPPKQRVQPKILGAQPLPIQAPRVLDTHSRGKPVEIQTKTHGELVTVRSHIRAKPTKKSDPDVRLRAMTKEDREAWKNVKQSKWEPE